MKLSIIIPTYNEEKNIEEVLAAVLKVDIGDVEKEIIVVDDGSKDSTPSILKKYEDDERFKIHISEANGGKGTAIRYGLRLATGDYVLIQDADLEYSPEEYPKLLKPIQEDGARVVYGSRFKGEIKNMRWPNLFANKFLTAQTNLLFRTGISDVFTCYKVFERGIIVDANLHCKRFEFCQEATAKVARRGVKIHEVPIHYSGRTYDDGKKIGARDGFEAMWTLIKYRFIDDSKKPSTFSDATQEKDGGMSQMTQNVSKNTFSWVLPLLGALALLLFLGMFIWNFYARWFETAYVNDVIAATVRSNTTHQAEDMPCDGTGLGENIEDLAAKGDQARTYTGNEAVVFLCGPFEPIASGEYEAHFRLRITDGVSFDGAESEENQDNQSQETATETEPLEISANTPANLPIILDVVTDQGTTTLATREILPSELSAEYTTITLPFQTPLKNDIELRARSLGPTNVLIDQTEIQSINKDLFGLIKDILRIGKNTLGTS